MLSMIFFFRCCRLRADAAATMKRGMLIMLRTPAMLAAGFADATPTCRAIRHIDKISAIAAMLLRRC